MVRPDRRDGSEDRDRRTEDPDTTGAHAPSPRDEEGLTATVDVVSGPYRRVDEGACLGLFDLNCPQHFAPCERRDYAQFLDGEPLGYEVWRVDGRLVGACGLTGDDAECRRLSWILLDPAAMGLGVGSAMMRRSLACASRLGLRCVVIAASHLSAPFFARFGAVVVSETIDGWGPGMHRLDMEIRL